MNSRGSTGGQQQPRAPAVADDLNWHGKRGGAELRRLQRAASAPAPDPVSPDRAPKLPKPLLWWSDAGLTPQSPVSQHRSHFQVHDLEVARNASTYREAEKAAAKMRAWKGSGPFKSTSSIRENYVGVDSARAASFRGTATLSNFRPYKDLGDASPSDSEKSEHFRFWSEEQMVNARTAPVFTASGNHVGTPKGFRTTKWQKPRFNAKDPLRSVISWAALEGQQTSH